VLTYLILSAAVLYRYQAWPSLVPSADAMSYVEHGLAFRQFGLMSNFGTLRTYGYPLLIYFYSFIAGFKPLSIALVAGALQLTLYGVAVLWLTARIARQGKTLARATAIGLLLNPILVAVVGDVLTEGPTLILVVLALIALINSARAQRTAAALLWAVIGAVLTNFSLMIRPANVFLILAWNFGLLISLYRPRQGIQQFALLSGYCAAWLFSAAVTWAPQYFYNAALGSPGILPAVPILGIQLKWGIVLLKYATIVTGGHAEGLLFPNPWCVPPVPDLHPWLWYFEHPTRGLATILGHLFAGFNFEYSFVYIYDLEPVYALPLPACTWMVIAVGLLYAITLLGSISSAHPDRLAAIVMIGTLCVMVVTLNALIAVENRYNLIPFAVLSVVAAQFVLAARGNFVLRRSIVVVAVAAAVIGTMLSERMRGSALTWSADLAAYPCLAAARAALTP
jgi:hypothetical protein